MDIDHDVHGEPDDQVDLGAYGDVHDVPGGVGVDDVLVEVQDYKVVDILEVHLVVVVVVVVVDGGVVGEWRPRPSSSPLPPGQRRAVAR